MKKIVSLVLALSMVLSMFTTAFAGTTLKDVEGTEYEAAVSALVELGVVNGYEDGTYQPTRVVSRAEMAKLLVVSAGLEPAADVSKGATNFSDVAADHWATGYINVAAQYGYINGYPDGTFAPDATVSYAEAVTMAIRVLGYKSVVEAKGTWPTNYIAKAQELKVLEDVEYKSYSEGAVRGNVALVVWNMLTAPMWDVDSESETDGLNYRKTGITMIDKYFDDYEYIDEDSEFVVTGIEVADGKVEITVKTENKEVKTKTATYELAEGTPFIDLFGRTVSVLYNEKDEVAVMVIPSSSDKVVEGYKADDLDKYNFDNAESMAWGTEADNSYVKAVVGSGKKVDYYTAYDTTNTGVVDTVKDAKKDANKVTFVEGGSVTIPEEAIVLIDGEWATGEDVKAGDVLTTLLDDELYIVSREVVTGEFEAVTDETDGNTTEYYVTVDGDDYSVINGVEEVVEIDEDGDEVTTTELAEIITDDESKYYEEECTLYLNFLGEVARIEFEEVEDKENAGKFYVVTNIPTTWEVSDKSGTATYIELNGESYEIKNTVEVPEFSESGDVVLVKFDSKDRVKDIVLVATAEAMSAKSGDKYTFVDVSDADEILDKKNYISGDHKVTSSTTVVTITGVEDEDDVITNYEVKTSKGATELEGVKNAVVAYETDDAFQKAAYVFVWEDAKSTEKTYGIIDKYTVKNGTTYLTVDGTRYELDDDDTTTTSGDVGSVATFTENDGVITISAIFAPADLVSGEKVTDVDDRVFITSGEITIGGTEVSTVDLDKLEDDIKDYTFLELTVSLDVEASTDSGDVYEFTDLVGKTFEDIKVKKGDRVYADDAAELVIVIKGMED